MVFPNRNAFYYVLDRVTGEFLVGKPYAKQTWAKGLDDNGRPIRAPNTFPSLEGTTVWPAVAGANNWYSPTYSPRHELVVCRGAGSGLGVFHRRCGVQGRRAVQWRRLPQRSGRAGVGRSRAFDPATGDMKWEHKLFSPPWAGLLSTAGNLVFGSTNEGQVFALHASTGKPLWRFQAGGAARSNPISYSVDGKQYVAVTMGNSLYVFGI